MRKSPTHTLFSPPQHSSTIIINSPTRRWNSIRNYRGSPQSIDKHRHSPLLSCCCCQVNPPDDTLSRFLGHIFRYAIFFVANILYPQQRIWEADLQANQVLRACCSRRTRSLCGDMLSGLQIVIMVSLNETHTDNPLSGSHQTILQCMATSHQKKSGSRLLLVSSINSVVWGPPPLRAAQLYWRLFAMKPTINQQPHSGKEQSKDNGHSLPPSPYT